MADWIAALIAAFGGLLIGAIAARLVRMLLGRPNRPALLRQASGPLASLVFSVLLVAGLVTALGFVNDQALDDIPNDLVDYLPDALSALIVIIVGNIIATIAATTVEGALSRSSGRAREQLPRVVRIVVLSFAIILAAAQLGVDTTVINIAVAALLFSIGLGAALMIGFGSRPVAEEVAAGRALRRFLKPGDHIIVEGAAGEVLVIQSVGVEIRTTDGATVLVPNSQLLGTKLQIERPAPNQ
jgi:small-conductance mechanosensitive channel